MKVIIKCSYTFYFLLVVLILFLFGLHFLQRGLMSHYIQTFIMFKHVESGKHNSIHMSKIKKACSFQNFILGWSVYTVFFSFFHPGMNFIRLSFRREFIRGWNFISAKTCKQQETFHHRQGWFHPGSSFIPGWNFTCKLPFIFSVTESNMTLEAQLDIKRPNTILDAVGYKTIPILS